MPSASTKDGRRLTGYRGDTADSNHIGQIQHHSLYDDDMEDYQLYTATDDDDVYEEYDEDLDDLQQQQDDDQDDTGSELSIPDPNIDFDMVYALHTFAATVEGQASVVRGDALTLLDDSNSYWWLVKVLKTAEVGYIPAENIETPHERLARLNSHRNIELTRKDIQDAFPTPPSNKLKKRKRVTLAKGVQFQSQIIYGSSDDEEDFEAEFEQWDEKMRSDDSETDDQDSDEDSDDPYNYYDDHNQTYSDQADLYSPSRGGNEAAAVAETATYQQQQQRRSLVNTKPINNTSYVHHSSNNAHYTDPIDQYNQISNDSDIINDLEDHVARDMDRNTLNLEDETIKISLTPSIARGYDDQQRNSDSSIQSKLKKAAKLDKLLGPSASPEPSVQEQQRRNSKDSNSSKKEKSGIRKFFSRSSSSSGGSSKESKKSKKSATQSSLERQLSGGSNYETASISSQSTGMMSFDRDRQGSLDSSIMSAAAAVQPTQLKIYAGNITDFGHEVYRFALIYPSTTALELIHQVIHRSKDDSDDAVLMEENTVAYHDYYVIVKTLGGDEFTLVPSDKPLEIFHSLTAHLNTPMPSLKKARRISQLMGSDNTHIGGPTKETMHQQPDQVQFFLFSKTKRIEDGEIQIKVSLFPSRPPPPQQQQQHYNADQSKRVDKLVKIPSSILIKDAVTLLLEKFHILNGIVAGSTTNDIESLRLDGDDELVKYQLYINRDGQEHLLDTTDKLLDTFGVDQVPPIHYRRNSNPDRSSITVNITPPEKTETFFILKCMDDDREYQPHHQEQQHQQHKKPHRVMMRQDTPMPRQETTPTDGFTQQPLPQYQPQIVLDTRDVMSSPEDAMFESKPVLSSSPDSNEDVLSQLDEAIDTLTPTTPPPMAPPLHQQQQQQQQLQPQLQPPPPPPSQKQRPRPESTESMLFCNDFGMNDLMVIIRGAAQLEKPTQPARQSSYQIRSEISEVFKDSQTRLDQLEKELDRIMAEAVKVYP